MDHLSLAILAILFTIWVIYTVSRLKKSKQLFTKENFSKTISTWGFLTLMIMAVVLLGVLFIR
jgi:hypothetical protein